MSGIASAAVVTGLLSLALLWWLVRREAARWRRFRQVQGEPEVVARRVAASVAPSQVPPVRLMVFRSSTKRWEPAGTVGSRRHSFKHGRELLRRGKCRPRGSATTTCWPALVLDVMTRL